MTAVTSRTGAAPAPATPPADTPSGTTAPRTLPPGLGTPTRVTLVALLTVVTIELVRASGPLLDRAFASGVTDAAVTALGTYALPGVVAAGLLLAAGARRTGYPDGRVVLAGTGLLALGRLAAQATDGGTRYVIGLATVAVAVAVLTLAVSLVAGRPAGAHQAAGGLTVGVGLSVGLQMALGTWDAFWRHDLTGWTVTGVLVAGTVLVAWAVRRDVPASRPRRLWAFGLYLAIVVMMLANPAFAASQAGAPLWLAGLVLVVTSVLAVWLVVSTRLLSAAVRVGAAVAVPVTLVAAFWLPEAALVALGVLQLAVAVVVVGVLGSRRPAPPSVPRTSLATTAVGLGTILPLLLHQLDYDVPLGFPNDLVLVATGVVLAAAGLRRRTPPAPTAAAAGGSRSHDDDQPWRANPVRFLTLPALVLAVVGVWPTMPGHADGPTARAATVTVLDWNLHYGVEPATDVDLETIARTIEAQDPDVVTLQEVSRGWVLGGGADMATWLSRRLGMEIAFAPAADRQFGNAVLSRSTLTDVVGHELPYGAGPQRRSALSTTVALPDGDLRVTSVHLQHREANTPTRLDQLEVLLAEAPVDGPSVLAGDLNATPGSAELDLLTDAGWTSAVDAAGDPDAATTLDGYRIDWVLGQQVTFADARVLTDPRSSDHLPVVTRVTRTP